MTHNKLSRRFFLRGAGAALALPFLGSLLPKTARAEGPPPSFVGIGAWNGLYRMYGPASQLMPRTMESGGTLVGLDQTVVPGCHTVHSGALTKLAAANGGKISDIIDDAFTPYLSKMLMMQGLDYTGLGYFHHSGQFGAWHQTAGQKDGNPEMASLDVVLADYRAKVGLPGDLVAYSASSTDNQYGCSFRADGSLTASRFHNPATLWDKYFGNATVPTDFKALLVDRVLEDYKSLRSSGRLGSEDRLRLESHIAHLAATEQKVKSMSAVCMQMRPDDSLTDRQEILHVMNDVIVGLIACGMVNSFMGWAQALLNEDPDQWHVWSHQGYSNDDDTIGDATSYTNMIEQSRSVMKDMCLDLVTKLDQVGQLDNTVVVCIQEHNKRGHESWNVPVIAFGSAGGALKTDQYVDFRNIADRDDQVFSRFGFPMNQLYANLLMATGVPASEFESLNKTRAESANTPFKPGSGYGVNAIHPDSEFNMGPHYDAWTKGHDMSSWLPLVKA
jgi:hypothetical protein